METSALKSQTDMDAYSSSWELEPVLDGKKPGFSPYGSSLYEISAEPYTDKPQEELPFAKRVYNATINTKNIEPWSESLSLTDITNHIPWLGDQIEHINCVSRMGPVEYIKNKAIPTHIKLYDVTIRAFIGGGAHLLGNGLLAITSTVLAVALAIVTAVLFLGKCFDIADSTFKLTKDLTIYTLSYINQAIRGALVMIPLIGLSLAKGFDLVEEAAIELTMRKDQKI